MACGASVLGVVVCAFLYALREPGYVEPLVANCPIAWATASYGTEIRFHTFRGHPIGFPAFCDLLIRLEMFLARLNGGRTVLGIEGIVGRNQQEEPVLAIRVLIPPRTGPAGCLYRVAVSNDRGILAVSSGCSGSRTIEEYEFRGLPIKSAKGLTVDFYKFEETNFGSFPTNSTSPPVARLSL